MIKRLHKAFVLTVAALVGVLDEMVWAVGLVLFWYGLHAIYKPLAPVVIGAGLLWIAMRRAGFFVEPKKDE